MDPTAEFAPRQPHVVDHTPWRYEVIRPLVRLADRTATPRAQDTHTHPETVRALTRRFRRQGMVGLLPAQVEVIPRGRAHRVPQTVRQELRRLKALYAGLHARELARILFCTCGYRIDHTTVKPLWPESPVPTPRQRARWDDHRHPDRYQARWQVIQRSSHGWDTIRIHRFLHVSRATIDAWMARFEAEHLAGLLEKKRGPKEPPRQMWLPRMVQVYHRQKAHPDAGEFRIWSLLAPPDISVRTVGRIMALNRLVD
jgi:hypothetical protein